MEAQNLLLSLPTTTTTTNIDKIYKMFQPIKKSGSHRRILMAGVSCRDMGAQRESWGPAGESKRKRVIEESELSMRMILSAKMRMIFSTKMRMMTKSCTAAGSLGANSAISTGRGSPDQPRLLILTNQPSFSSFLPSIWWQ